jgi:nucleoside-diphosphate-sugar epimerase
LIKSGAPTPGTASAAGSADGLTLSRSAPEQGLRRHLRHHKKSNDMTERQKIFLLGGTGFVGSALTRQLSANRAANELVLLVHRTAPFRSLEQVNTFTGSLGALDLSLLDRCRPDTILHLARMSGRGKIGRYLAAMKGARANRRIIRHLAHAAFKPHVIYVSGTLVYGDCGNTPVDEDSPLHPTAFAREYIRAERPWMDALLEGVLPVTILRPPWIIGPGSWFAAIYLKYLRTRGSVPLFGDGKNFMSLIDVGDCAGLIAHAVRHAEPGRYRNLFVPGACVTQLEFAERLAQLTGTRIERLAPAAIKRAFGPTMLEAFTFSNNASTKYPEFLSGYDFQYRSVDEMLRHNLPMDVTGASADQSLTRKV